MTLLTPTDFKVPMLDGKARERNGLSFTVPSLGGLYRLAVHKCGPDSCIVSDFRTGLKISHEWTGDPKEAALGVVDMVKVGALDVHRVMEAARAFPTINRPLREREEVTA